MAARFGVLLVVVVAAALVAGCGVKGDVKPAWKAKLPAPPKRVRDLTAEVRSGRVWLTFTEPTKNTDGSVPVRLDRYLVYYEELPLEEKYCLTCPLDLSQKLELDPVNPGEAQFADGRVTAPVTRFSLEKKYVFIVLALDPDDRSAGDSNIATLNWPDRGAGDKTKSKKKGKR